MELKTVTYTTTKYGLLLNHESANLKHKTIPLIGCVKTLEIITGMLCSDPPLTLIPRPPFGFLSILTFLSVCTNTFITLKLL